jgi:FkbM family methyltransferase
MPHRDRNYSVLFFRGEYDAPEAALLRRVLRAGDFVVDAGAHVGWYTILMASIVGPQGCVWAFEPVPSTQEMLSANIALNADAPIRVFSVALGSSSGETDIHTFDGLPTGHASVSALGRDDYITHRVERTTLDEIIERRPALLKLDVEGSELEVLRGAAALLSSEAAPMVLMEANQETTTAVGHCMTDIYAELTGHGFRVFRVAEDGLRAEHAPEAAHGVGWIAVPAGKIQRLHDVLRIP